jgi:hypothetical protein
VVAGLLAFGWRNRNTAADSPQFAFTLSAFFIATAIVLPLVTPFNQVLLILPALMIVRDWAILPRLARIAFTAVISWPWLAALGLLLFRPRLDGPGRLPLLPSVLVLFVPFLLLALLMTSRVRIRQS